MSARYCDCGRKIVVIKKGWWGTTISAAADEDHVLCQKCWQAEKDRKQWQAEKDRKRWLLVAETSSQA